YGFKDKKSFQMTFDKLILYDFYLKYPATMFGRTEKIRSYDFEELFSFYHSEPDRDNYHKMLRFLIAKNLVSKIISKGSYIYQITDLGQEIISEIKSPYGSDLIEYSKKISTTISKLSDSKVKEEIHTKSKDNIEYSF